MSGAQEPRRLASLTTVEATEALRPGVVLFLPVGSTEAHGPHLPLETDVLLAEETARRAGRELSRRGIPAFLLPAVAYSQADWAAPFPGTVSVSAPVLETLVADVARSLAPAGGPVLCVVNGHLEPDHIRSLRRAVRHAAAAGCRAVFGDQMRSPWIERMGEEFRLGGGHAGGYETSLLLAAGGRVEVAVQVALPPNPVDLAAALRQGPPDFRAHGGEQAYFGDPAGATREEGERLYGVLVEAVLEAVDGELSRSS